MPKRILLRVASLMFASCEVFKLGCGVDQIRFDQLSSTLSSLLSDSNIEKRRTLAAPAL